MPVKRKARRTRKSPSTQASHFVREEIEHIREGLHGAANVRQAIAIGLAKARKAGVPLPPRAKAARRRTKLRRGPARRKRARVTLATLKRQPRTAASRRALSTFAQETARKRGRPARRAVARRAVMTKGPIGRRRAAMRAARTRTRVRKAR